MGVVYLAVGAFDEARAALASALKLRTAAGDDNGRGETLLNRGSLGLLTGNYAAALADYQAALDLPAVGEYRRRRGYALEGKAEALYKLGRRQEVHPLLEQSLAMLQEVGDKGAESFTWSMLGEAESSRDALERAVALAAEVGDGPSQAVSLVSLARLQFQQHSGAARSCSKSAWGCSRRRAEC